MASKLAMRFRRINFRLSWPEWAIAAILAVALVASGFYLDRLAALIHSKRGHHVESHQPRHL